MTGILLENCNIFDGVNDGIAADQYIGIEGDQITYIGAQKPEIPVSHKVNLAGRFVTPGFIDAHFHAYALLADFKLLEELPATYTALGARGLLEAALSRGFTTVRDAGGADYGLWRALEDGLIQGPRLRYAGRALSQTGGHADIRSPHLEGTCSCILRGNLGHIVDGVEDLRKAVREELRRGAHHIKLMASGGVVSPTDPIWMSQYSEEEILAVVDEADRRRTYVMAHAYTAETIMRAVRCGVRSIEHGNLLDEPAARLMAEHGAYLVPTLITYEAIHQFGRDHGMPETALAKLSEVKSAGQTAIERARQAGVPMGFGTDLVGDMHQHQLREFALRADVQKPVDVLRSATSINAGLLNMTGEIGIVEVGAKADLVVLERNPLESLSELYGSQMGPFEVIKGGKFIKGTLS